jgi:hypothetical protein
MWSKTAGPREFYGQALNDLSSNFSHIKNILNEAADNYQKAKRGITEELGDAASAEANLDDLGAFIAQAQQAILQAEQYLKMQMGGLE